MNTRSIGLRLRPPGFEPAPVVNVSINIGACLDIPTGEYLMGKHGEAILNGGLQPITGFLGEGNTFKSTIMHYMLLSGMNRVSSMAETYYSIYDTEMNVREERLLQLAIQFSELYRGPDDNISKSGALQVTNKVKHMADEWYDILKAHLNEKRKDKNCLVETPFLDRDGVSYMKILLPTFGAVDSIVHFEDSVAAKMLSDNSLGESGQNTYFIKTGTTKAKFLSDLPTLLNGAYHFMGIVAQIGDKIDIPTGPVKVAPRKDLGFLPADRKIKGATKHFTYLLQNGWYLRSASPLINKTSKEAEYQRSTKEAGLSVDLNSVEIQQLRGKGGHSGFRETLIVSMAEGVQPTLTEFHRIREFDYFGLMGNQQNYHVALYPKVKLSRNTVRGHIASDPLLCRAINIVSEMSQIIDYKAHLYEDLICTPQQLYDDLIGLGYDWDQLLRTRGWWTINNDQHPIPYLSTLDLLRMRKGLYTPYWMEKKESSGT